MKQLVSLLVIAHAVRFICADPESKMTLNHPDKNGYQSGVAGTDKHKYGYEIKENRAFHHTTTERDGVRLGCYGYELEGKMYSTQYVADARGYRIVSNQDLITVYPKSGEKTRKASFVGDFNEDPSVSSNIRYFFPSGCKGIDVLIDNSSRLRSIAMTNGKPRLPVTMKTTRAGGPYTYTTPPNSYIPPGPAHIYALNQIHIPIKLGTPPNTYLPPKDPNNTYLPPDEPTNTYLPPVEPTNTYLPPTEPPVTYLPPFNSHNKPTKPQPTLSHEIAPPKLPEGNCGQSSCCDESTTGKFVIPIPMRTGDGCCNQVAKLIIPLKGFDPDSVQKLSNSLTEDFDATELIRSVLKNLM